MITWDLLKYLLFKQNFFQSKFCQLALESYLGPLYQVELEFFTQFQENSSFSPMPQDEKQNCPLSATLSSLLECRRQRSLLRALTTRSSSSTDFSSNDFLSLSTSPELRHAFLQELNNPDAPRELASGGSRLLDGNSPYAESLEQSIATFHNAPSGLLCNSGFDANVGLFSCLPQPGDVVIFDELIHASVHEGMRLSRAGKRMVFAHSCISSFRKVLRSCIDGDHLVREGTRNVFVAVEAIYSMEGDVAPLRKMVEAVEELLPLRNGYLIADEAHSTGVLGPKGRGLVCELGLESRVFVRLHTFGKALACTGGKSYTSYLVLFFFNH